MLYYVYGLQDPNTLGIRYVGITDNLTSRTKSHLTNHISSASNHTKADWINDLKENQKLPNLIILEEHKRLANAQSAERWWIAQGSRSGWKLTNRTGNYAVASYADEQEYDRTQPTRNQNDDSAAPEDDKKRRNRISYAQQAVEGLGAQLIAEHYGVQFPITSRPLTEEEAMAIKEISNLDVFRYKDKLSLNRLVSFVYVSKNGTKLTWIKEALGFCS